MPADVIFPISVRFRKSDIRLILKELRRLRRERDWYEKLLIDVEIAKTPMKAVGADFDEVLGPDPFVEGIKRQIAYRNENIHALERVLQILAERRIRD